MTALSIMFFFAVIFVFNKIDVLTASSTKEWGRKLAELGGVAIEEVELKVTPKDGLIIDSSWMNQVKSFAKSLEGEAVFAVRPEHMRKQIESITWVQKVDILRKLPNRIEINLKLRKPDLVLHGQNVWVVADSHGNFMGSSKSLHLDFFDLPIVFGLERLLVGEPAQMNRSLLREKRWLTEVSELKAALEERLLIDVKEIRIDHRDWLGGPVFKLTWIDQENSRSLESEFLSGHWQNKLDDLQYVLSEIDSKDFRRASLKGQYSKRWIVDLLPEES